jgi:glycosyltransferase involved in cell wall biosynthesis
MIKFISRHEKDYSRYNILKDFVKEMAVKNDIYLLFPFSKNQFIKNFFKRDQIVNDFFISNYDTYVYDRKKITKWNPRAWWKYVQDWINFKCSKYLLSDTYEHFIYWESLFGTFKGKLFVLPVLADSKIYFPSETEKKIAVPKILFYGSFIPLHGIDVILHALKILENDGADFEAEIIGNGQTYKNMKSLFESLQLSKVVMKGELIQEAVLGDRIRQADIILGIFGSSTKAKSVIPNKVYQALASKKAIVTMRSKALEEFFGDEDLVTCENTAEALADALKVLISNPDKIDTLALNGYQKYNQLYNDTREKFRDFVHSIDSEIGK